MCTVSAMYEVTEIGKDSGGWLAITRTIANVFEMHRDAKSIFGVTDNPFLVRDQCLSYIRALMTLMMAILNSFDLDDRVREYTLLDALSFDDLLHEMHSAISSKEDAALFGLYLHDKEAAVQEMQMTQLGLAERDLEYLKDALIRNGHIEHFSNILQNMTTFPDDALSAASCSNFIYPSF